MIAATESDGAVRPLPRSDVGASSREAALQRGKVRRHFTDSLSFSSVKQGIASVEQKGASLVQTGTTYASKAIQELHDATSLALAWIRSNMFLQFDTITRREHDDEVQREADEKQADIEYEVRAQRVRQAARESEAHSGHRP